MEGSNPPIPNGINMSVSKEFTSIPDSLIYNKELNLTEKGLIMTLITESESGHGSIENLKKLTSDSPEMVEAVLHNIHRKGYMTIYPEDGLNIIVLEKEFQ